MATTNEMIETVQPVLDYLLKLRLRFSENEDISLNSVRSHLLNLIHEMEIGLKKLPSMGTKIELAKYVLTALADEMLIFSKWSHAEEWKELSLEKELFDTNVSGERFFELLEKEGRSDPSLAELFYICLCLGFQRKKADVLKMKQNLYMLISSRLPDDERHLSPGAQKAIKVEEKRLPPLFGVWTLVIVMGVSVMFYYIAGKWIWDDAVELIHAISLELIKGY